MYAYQKRLYCLFIIFNFAVLQTMVQIAHAQLKFTPAREPKQYFSESEDETNFSDFSTMTSKEREEKIELLKAIRELERREDAGEFDFVPSESESEESRQIKLPSEETESEELKQYQRRIAAAAANPNEIYTSGGMDSDEYNDFMNYDEDKQEIKKLDFDTMTSDEKFRLGEEINELQRRVDAGDYDSDESGDKRTLVRGKGAVAADSPESAEDWWKMRYMRKLEERRAGRPARNAVADFSTARDVGHAPLATRNAVTTSSNGKNVVANGITAEQYSEDSTTEVAEPTEGWTVTFNGLAKNTADILQSASNIIVPAGVITCTGIAMGAIYCYKKFRLRRKPVEEQNNVTASPA